MNVYLNELYTHPFWTAFLIIFLWRIVVSFRHIESVREMVIVTTTFFFLLAATPIFIGVPFTAIQEKTIYGIMYLLVFPIFSVYWLYWFWRFSRYSTRRFPVLLEISFYVMFGGPGLFLFIDTARKLFLQ